MAFWLQSSALVKQISAAKEALKNALKKSQKFKIALSRSHTEPGKLDEDLMQIITALQLLDVEINGPGSHKQVGEKHHVTISDRLSSAYFGTNFSTYGPTQTHKRSLEIVEKQFVQFKLKLDKILNTKMPQLEKALDKVDAPWVEGSKLPEAL